jgi:hypothetical protein
MEVVVVMEAAYDCQVLAVFLHSRVNVELFDMEGKR